MSKINSQRVLGRRGARELIPEEIKQVNGGTTIAFNTPLMTFIGTNDPDFRPDVFND